MSSPYSEVVQASLRTANNTPTTSNQNQSSNQSPGITSPSRGSTGHNGRHDSSITADRNNNRDSTGMKQTYSPSRKCAVVLQDTQGVTQDQCLRAVADQIGGHNIHYITRLSGQRICLYLTDQKTVDTICEGGGIAVDSQFIQIRRYITEAKKVVISNCPPEVSDEDLKKILSPYGTFASPPTRLKVTTVHEDLKHIRTWRRSVYMMLHEEGKGPQLPERMVITSPTDDYKQTLYIDRNEVICNFCLGPGHVEQKCKRKEQLNADFPAMPTFNAPVGNRLFVHTKDQVSKTSSSHEPTKSLNDFVPSFLQQQMNQQMSTSQETFSFSEPISVHKNTEVTGIQTPIQFNQPTTEEEIDEEVFPLHSNQQPPQTDQEDLLNKSQSEISSLEWDDPSQPFANDAANEKSTIDKKKRKHSPEELDDPKVQKTNESLDSETESVFLDSSSESSSKITLSKKQIKKKKKEEVVLQKLLETISFDDSILSAEQFKTFLLQCRGKANSQKIACQVTNNITELISKLERGIILCPDHNLTRRLERACAALKETNV